VRPFENGADPPDREELLNIVNLADFPRFADTVADRGWKAWFADGSVTIEEYRNRLEPMLSPKRVPFCLVAEQGGVYAGSVLVIESDMEERPQYAPWIAALWVDPDHRGNGVGRQLLFAACEYAFDLGHRSCYLCTIPDNDEFYLGSGFELLESHVDGLNIFVKSRR
jgi:GNAT superfamily N-acetyltransferase